MRYSIRATIFLLESFDFRNESFFEIRQVYHQTRFTEKIQIRAYTFDDLVGSCGGFIGLFLGYALVQIPHLIESMLHALIKNFSSQSATKCDQQII